LYCLYLAHLAIVKMADKGPVVAVSEVVHQHHVLPLLLGVRLRGGTGGGAGGGVLGRGGGAAGAGRGRAAQRAAGRGYHR
jgi:hypothetical protein